jgi:hypothetical protein
MQLSESERKTLEQAKKLNVRWPKIRWLTLALGLGMVSIGIIHFSAIPEAPMLLGLGAAQLALLPKAWRERPMLKLLLKYADENRENANRCATAP